MDIPSDRSVVVGGLRLRYRDWGGRGQHVVLLHGLASTRHIWDLVAPILAADFSVVALDQRGHGESDKPDGGYDFATVSGDLHGFVEALGLEHPVVVGHSWGGNVALEYGVAHPGVPRGLCFVDGGTIEVSARPGMTLERAKRDMAPPVFTGVTVDEMRERARAWRPELPPTPEIEEIRLSNFEVLQDNTVRAKLSHENHMRVIEAFWEHKPSVLYSQVECPVLLMPARQTNADPERARRFRGEEAIALAEKRLRRSSTVWLEDSIHDVPLQRPGLVADVIRGHIRSGFFD